MAEDSMVIDGRASEAKALVPPKNGDGPANPFTPKPSKKGPKPPDKGNGEYHEQPPAGNHPAVLIGLIDLGTHEESFQGQKPTKKRKVMLVWELTTEKMSGMKDANHVIANRYTFSMHPKAGLRKVLESWRGKKYGDDEQVDVSAVLGKPCLLSVTHSTAGDRLYANVAGVQSVPKAMAVPAAQRTPVSWLVGGALSDLPDWLPYIYGEPVIDVVKRCRELNGGAEEKGDAAGGNLIPAGAYEAIPF